MTQRNTLPSSEKTASRVAVCACTFRRREGLTALLDGLRQQRFRSIAAPDIWILIVDNEGSERAKTICANFMAHHGLCVRYLLEPRRGIAFARNCGLDAVPPDVDFVALIDDDERPEPDWLEELLLAQAATSADVVQGPVRPAFAKGTAGWICDGGFFGYPLPPSPFRRETWADLQVLPSAASNNVLIRAAAVADTSVRFDPRLGLTGGSDALFFRKLKAAGYRIVYAERAVVHEDVPLARARLGYLWRRSYRDGAKRLAAKLWAKGVEAGPGWRVRGRLALRAAAQAAKAGAWLLAQGIRRPGDRALLAHGLIELANGFGTMAACAGFAYEHYRRAGEAPGQPAAAPR